jgi:hypothetical protein
MNPLLFFLPAFAVYLVIRAVMHKRAGKPKWFMHYLVMAGFMLCIFAFECWMYFRSA